MLLLTLIRHNMIFISIKIVFEFHFTNKWSWHRKKFRRTAIIIKKYINNFMSFSLLCPLDPMKKQKMFHTNKKFSQLKIFFFDDQKMWKVACCRGSFFSTRLWWLFIGLRHALYCSIMWRPRRPIQTQVQIPLVTTIYLYCGLGLRYDANNRLPRLSEIYRRGSTITPWQACYR